MKSLKSGLVVSLAVLLSAACTVTETTNTNTNRNSSAPVAATPANTNAASTNSNTSGSAAALDAVALFNNDSAPKCASCHRADGKGVEAMKASMKDLPDFTNAAWQKKATDAEMIETIKNGHKPMPAYKDKLNDEQIKALVAYARSLAK